MRRPVPVTDPEKGVEMQPPVGGDDDGPDGKKAQAPKRKFRERVASGFQRLTMKMKLFGTDHALLVGLYQAVLLAYFLAMYAVNIGTVVYTKPGLTIGWLPAPQDTFAWLRGRWGLLHVFTFLEFLYFLAPQTAVLIVVSGRRIPQATRILRLVFKVLCAAGIMFAVAKFVVYMIAAMWCADVPDCTRESLVLGTIAGRRAFFARIMESLVAAALLWLDGDIIDGYVVQTAQTARAMKGDMSVTARDDIGHAMMELAFVGVQMLLEMICFVLLALTASSVVYPKTGLTIDWLTEPGLLVWAKERFGAQHILLILEVVYLIGPQAAITYVTAGYRSKAPGLLFMVAAHVFNILAIVLLLLKLIVFACMCGKPSVWPESTTEAVPPVDAVDTFFIVRIIFHALLFCVYLVNEVFFGTMKNAFEKQDEEHHALVAIARMKEHLTTTAPAPQ